VQFLIDAQLPPDLAVLLASQGHAAQHVAEFGLTDASDRKIWSHALAIGAIIVTKDSDFADRLNLEEGPQVVWIRFGNTRKAELRRRLTPLIPQIIAALQRGDRLVEVK
jgi:predicted nuclease of predicted toxin-antitoxin system